MSKDVEAQLSAELVDIGYSAGLAAGLAEGWHAAFRSALANSWRTDDGSLVVSVKRLQSLAEEGPPDLCEQIRHKQVSNRSKGRRGWAIKDPTGRFVNMVHVFDSQAEAWDDVVDVGYSLRNSTRDIRVNALRADGYHAVRCRVVEEP